MKTLYINISGKNVQSTGDIIVVGGPKDALINKFLFDLGNEISRGVYAPSIKDKKKLVTDFWSAYPDVYEKEVGKQLDELKYLMLSEDRRGKAKIQLPKEYIYWLSVNGTSEYAEIAKSLSEKGGVVEIDLDRIYRNGIILLINSIAQDNYNQLVVNDEAVADDTEMVNLIRNKLNNSNVPFTPLYEYNNICPKCGKIPCECVKEEVCQKCGESPCKCEYYSGNARFVLKIEDGSVLLFDSKGKLSCNKSFLLVEGYNLDYLTESKLLFAKCIDDDWLYFISEKAIVPICEYKNGAISDRRNKYDVFNPQKFFFRKGNMISICTNKKGSDVYEILGNTVKKLFHSKYRITNEELGCGYIYDEEDDVYNSVLVNVETCEKKRFKGLEVYPIGVLNGKEAFVLAREGQECKFPIITLEGKELYQIDIDKEDLYSIEVINNDTLEFNCGYYLLDRHEICTDFKGNLYVKETEYSYSSLFERSSGRLLYELDLSNFDDLGNGIYCIYISKDGKGVAVIVDQNGKQLYLCEKGESPRGRFSDGLLALYDDDGYLRRIINSKFEDIEKWPRGYRDLCFAQEQFVYGKLVVIDNFHNQVGYIDVNGKEHIIPYSFEETIESVNILFDNAIYVKDEYNHEYIITEKGEEIIPCFSFQNIQKLSEGYFCAWNINEQTNSVFDIYGKKVRFDKLQDTIVSVAVI